MWMQTDELKVPPYSAEAEISVVGAVLIDREAVYRIMDVVTPEDFYDDRHKYIMRIVYNLAREQKPIDIVSVSDGLKKINKLVEVGGVTYLARLADSVPNSANAEYYAEVVKEKSLLRQLIRIGSEISDLGFNASMDAREAVSIAEQKIFALSTANSRDYFKSMSELAQESYKLLEKRYKERTPVVGIPTGYKSVDKIIGGFQKSDLAILAARPSVGKTSFAVNIIDNIAVKDNYSVALFSLEMSDEQITEKLACSHARIDMQRMRNGFLTEDDWKKLTQTYAELSEAKIYIDDSPGLTATDIEAKSRKLKAEKDIDFIIIDYLQLLHTTQRFENRVLEVSYITRMLKKLARELDIPILALSQLSRSVEKRENKTPMLSDLRESGSIEQDADVVMFLYRPEPDLQSSVDLYVAKQRNGPIGTSHLLFIKEYTRFQEMDIEHEEEK
jgi:replicative DNA helicase